MGPGLVQLREAAALGAPSSILDTCRRGWRRLRQTFHSSEWWEGKKQWHKLKYERLSLEKPFPYKDSQEVGTRPTKAGPSPVWRVSCPGWVKPQAAQSEPMVEPALGMGCEWRPHQIHTSLNRFLLFCDLFEY